MNVFKAVLLGIIQGLTEFLPISSSGHLVIASRLLDFNEPGIVFEVFLHGGTLFAVILAFRKELGRMVRSLFVSAAVRRADPELNSAFQWNRNIVIATLPAVVFGLLLKNSIDFIFATIVITFSMLALSGVLMLLTLRLKEKGLPVTWPRALAIGFAQALAIMPGLSRSGATIFTGLLLGINRETAARFSFIMSIPAILGAMAIHISDLLIAPPTMDQMSYILAGTVASVISGYGAIVLLMRVVRRGKLHWFGYYCLLVSAIGFFWYFMHE